ncbi:hypothetical protein [Legionella sp. CNM-4043-24]|uniref:hypothetical protein n=1 Tax=Legionella sp. CNM-4043-24 TaxID=3421646 RepID=UPI00403B34BA
MPFHTDNKLKISSSELHRLNCYRYLMSLKTSIPAFIFSRLPDSIADRLRALYEDSTNHADVPYAILYRDLMGFLENNLRDIIEEWIRLEGDDVKAEIDYFILSLYDNDNNNLHLTFDEIKHIPMTKRPVSRKTESAISSWLADSESARERGYKSPADNDSNIGRFTTMVADDFKPQLETNLPTRRSYEYRHDTNSIELRIATQGERHHGEERVNPLFELFLTAQHNISQRNAQCQHKSHTHVYFNNLGLHRSAADYEGNKESRLSKSLHDLEMRHPNIAVITLPADKGLMNRNHYSQTRPMLSAEGVYKQFLRITRQDNREHDFRISKAVRQAAGLNRGVFEHLLSNSFRTMGVRDLSQPLSFALKQAIWVDFIKYELPNHIINTLSPHYYNFSCKDAIDRGGISSAYFNLMNSIRHDAPLSREEFECALHAAPAMVKGRGINSHLNIIWNAIDAYIEPRYNRLTQNPDILWLIRWRDANCPHARTEELLTRRIQQTRFRLQTMQGPAIRKALNILAQIDIQLAQGVSGKRLLLETVSVLDDLICNPGSDSHLELENLANEMEIKYPALQLVAGLLKTFIAVLAYAPTLGYSRGWMTSGWATAKAAFHADTRRALLEQMRTPDHYTRYDEDDGELVLVDGSSLPSASGSL